MSEQRITFEHIATSLEGDGASVRNMFGHRCLTVVGKGFAIDFDGDMVFKLQDTEHATALALSGSQLFDPMHGRPMREWVQVPKEHADRWYQLAEAAMRYVADLNS